MNHTYGSIRRPATFLSLGLIVMLLAACSGAGSGATSSPSGGGGGAVTLKVSQSNLGMILTDAGGRTLYAFTKDTAEKSACSGSCAANWPALTVASGQTASAGDGTTGEWIHTITRDDGATQLSYGGHPLYYYAADTAAGDTNGQGSGGLWFALTGDGQLVQASASPTASAGASASARASAEASASASGGYSY